MSENGRSPSAPGVPGRWPRRRPPQRQGGAGPRARAGPWASHPTGGSTERLNASAVVMTSSATRPSASAARWTGPQGASTAATPITRPPRRPGGLATGCSGRRALDCTSAPGVGIGACRWYTPGEYGSTTPRRLADRHHRASARRRRHRRGRLADRGDDLRIVCEPDRALPHPDPRRRGGVGQPRDRGRDDPLPAGCGQPCRPRRRDRGRRLRPQARHRSPSRRGRADRPRREPRRGGRRAGTRPACSWPSGPAPRSRWRSGSWS